MRIIAGTHRGFRLDSLKSRSLRPTADRTKEIIFNVLQDVSGIDVLDVYAGTGSLGIEALSRGAAKAVFIERSRAVGEVLLRNLARTSFTDKSEVLKSSANAAMLALSRRGRTFSLIVADPPYHTDSTVEVANMIVNSGLLDIGGRLVVEGSSRGEPGAAIDGLALAKTKTAGDSRLSFYVNEG